MYASDSIRVNGMKVIISLTRHYSAPQEMEDKIENIQLAKPNEKEQTFKIKDEEDDNVNIEINPVQLDIEPQNYQRSEQQQNSKQLQNLVLQKEQQDEQEDEQEIQQDNIQENQNMDIESEIGTMKWFVAYADALVLRELRALTLDCIRAGLHNAYEVYIQSLQHLQYANQKEICTILEIMRDFIIQLRRNCARLALHRFTVWKNLTRQHLNNK
ncbi:MAG: hypothetical protein EZS28_046429 [Streblomastix strix]|uniref:Uncharacterized protein n=1 Tax=Streblomastix strix TaxID=222440 RepID=A0A5J4TI43_9EUKA|nr:MAG: hypothetical protein EZS28_046429 [Streblomastix strix]